MRTICFTLVLLLGVAAAGGAQDSTTTWASKAAAPQTLRLRRCRRSVRTRCRVAITTVGLTESVLATAKRVPALPAADAVVFWPVFIASAHEHACVIAQNAHHPSTRRLLSIPDRVTTVWRACCVASVDVSDSLHVSLPRIGSLGIGRRRVAAQASARGACGDGARRSSRARGQSGCARR
jgi:hypothetical protein